MPNHRPVHRCDYCSREFARSEHLIRHERTHTKEKPYKCASCTQSFSRPDLLRRHEAKAHNKRRPNLRRLTRTMTPVAEPPSRSITVWSSSVTSEPDAHTQPMADGGETFPIAQPLLPQFGNPHQDLQSLDPWMSGVLQDAPEQQELDQSIHRYLISDPSNWLHGCPGANPEDNVDFSAVGVTQLTPGRLEAFANNYFQSTERHSERPSILSRPASPDQVINDVEIVDADPPLRSSTVSEISDEYVNVMQNRISETSQFILPSRHELSGYISRYFGNFNRHQPLIHDATWLPNQAPVPLVLAVCANGSVYSLEHSDAVELYRLSLSLLRPTDSGIWVLQTLMLLTAFASWSGNQEDLQTAIQLHGRMTFALRQEWILQVHDPMAQSSWDTWLAEETLKRVTYCVFTVLNLMNIAFDIPSPVSLEPHYGMPSHESQWAASTEQEWIAVSSEMPPQVWKSGPAILDRLFDQSHPVPTNVGMFGCHVIVSLLLQHIIYFRRSHSSSRPGFEDTRRGFVQALRRWQTMWESEPQSSLSPDNPRGPILFNCTAMLRLAYIRLVSDYSPLRNSFSFLSSDSGLEQDLNIPPCPLRTPDTARAAMHATLALYVPAKLGFKVVSRTSFWVWSVQHSLSYFECALLLSQWLQTVEGADDLLPEETRIKRMVEDILQYSKPRRSGDKSLSQPLSVAVLLLWAELLDTRDTTVWKIMPKMSRILKRYSEAILCDRPATTS